MRNSTFGFGVASLCAIVAIALPARAQTAARVLALAPAPNSVTLFDFADSEKAGHLSLSAPAKRGVSVTLQPPNQKWDIGDFTRLELDVANAGTQPMQIRVSARNLGANDWSNSAVDTGFLAPGQRKIFNLLFPRQFDVRDRYPELKPFVGMSGLPGGLLSHWHTLDARDVRSLQIEIVGGQNESGQNEPQQLQLFSIRATHPVVPAILREKGASFFPFVDRFGQYRYADWPGKIHDDAELKRSAQAEARDLNAHPAPASWDRFGGWKGGPQLEATGHFGVVKRDGKWWLVDPDGHLFWSHGPNSVGIESAGTRVSGRESFFQALPPRALKGVWHQDGKPSAPLDVNFVAWNMERQYGANWAQFNRDLTHRRLRSWGMNTIGNWSNTEIQEMNRTPFTASLWPWSPTFDGDTNWDVFNPDFASNFEKGIQNGVEKYAANPWCIGFFVHNEMSWPGNALGFTSTIMAANPTVYTKREFIQTLRQTMPDIADFNRATGQNFASWDAVFNNRKGFDLSGVRAPAEAFYERYGDLYFKTCAGALHKYAPGKLYLGSRMHVSNPIAVRSAAKFCDVLSFNLYRSDVSGFGLDGADKPVLASEFHFGALDRGTLGTGLQSASDQNDRADKYRFYVEGALKNPIIVGAHWFAYCPQAITGRADGENYEDGLFDNTNNPYYELRAAIRDVGTRIYKIRSEN